MEQILGIDLGTNSIGLTLRENNEFTWYGVYTFKKGVGEGKSGEFSFAAERTKHRSSRRLYNARRYRKWETLQVLIENDFCPLSIENLNNWKNYKKGIGRVFPVDDKTFQQWIKLDFNGDGVPDYSSPYQLRRFLIMEKLDLNAPENRYKIGRALYHITQRRGFKSSRKQGANEKTAVYKGSNETKTIGRNEYEDLIIKNGTIGAAFATLEDCGIRIRNRYTLRSDYRNEVGKILDTQEVLDEKFIQKLLLETSNGSIFYQRPLRSQKSLVGKCTLEPNKARCPISHPRFEEYRTWSFINNIKYRTDNEAQFVPIPLELKEKLFQDKFFFKSKREFDFSDIRKFIKSNGGKDWELNYSQKMDKVSVSSCYVSARLKSVFGNEWETIRIDTGKTKVIKKTGDVHKISFGIEDIWHILFSFEDEEYFEEFLLKTLNLNVEQVKELKSLFNSFPVGYANLSLKAINNILPFLRQGLIYSDAVILAKVPEILGREVFEANKEIIIKAINVEVEANRDLKKIVTITNNLIFKYYALDFQVRFGWKDIGYKLDDTDLKEIELAAEEHFGDKTWLKLEKDYKQKILVEVAEQYQAFFTSSKREHLKPPHLVNQIKQFLNDNFTIDEKILDKIYHPSQINIYPKKEGQEFLLSPKTASFKNPMAYKTLYRLQDVINYLINTGKIDEDTRIVVEIARELNDSNKRWAIETYQRQREAENREFATAIAELIKDPEFSGVANPESDVDADKFRLWTEQMDNYEEILKLVKATKTDIEKYRLWKEQNCMCMYTGKPIKISDLFNTNKVDFEHTIPRSISFDNSLANLTVCYADYNRSIKYNKMPFELPNYESESHGYTAIKPRLVAWEKKVENAFNQIDFWKAKSKRAMDKNEKDNAIRSKHLWQFEYDYWKNKLDRFTRTEVPQGFVNSQLVDTQIISKYAFHYLKTVFHKVDVIKGTQTAQFRKIFEIQPKAESKDRNKHHHHAVDAAVLTLLPSSRKREEILKKFYEYEEENKGKSYHEKPFKDFKFSMIEEIQKNILINNIANKDQTLTLGKKTVRKRGKVVWLRDKNGKVRVDENGNKIPKIAQGDSIRGELHQQTYYGKIKMVERDVKGVPLRNEDGGWKFFSSTEEFKYVLRIPIEKLTSLDKLVDPHLAKMIESQLKGKSLATLIKEGVFMFDKNGNIVNKIRRVRCWAAVTEPLDVKKQTYVSKHVHKNMYYAANAVNYCYALYEGVVNNKLLRSFEIVNLFDLSKIAKNIPNHQLEVEPNKKINKKGDSINLKEILKPQIKVIFYIENKNELLDLPSLELSQRVYFIVKLMKDGRITFAHHLDARSDEQLLKDYPKDKFGKKGINGFSNFSNAFIAPKLFLSPNNFNFIIEGKDFKMKLDGTIEFNY